MTIPLTVVDLIGSVALMLWGIHMVQTGIQRALGARLRLFLTVALKNRVKAFLAGMGVTAILQSSTATGLMITGFAAEGLVDLVPALAVMLGANVGTTLIVQVLSFDVAEVAPALILIGYFMFQRLKGGKRAFGRVMIGLGLVLMALHQIVALLTPYDDVPSLRVLLGAISTQPILDVLLAAGLTWAAHSSVSVVLLTMSFAARGTVPPDAAFALVLGANLGTAINPLLEGAPGGDPTARRLPLGNLVNRLVGVALALAVLPTIGRWMVMIEPDPARAVADFHTAFNVLLALVFLPLLDPCATLLRRWIPERAGRPDPAEPIYLDPGARDVPVAAIGGAAREALRMTDVLQAQLQGFRDMLEKPDGRQITENRQMDDILDKLNAAIKAYLVSLDDETMSGADHRGATRILVFATNLEQAGDIVDRNLLNVLSKKLKRNLAFSADEKADLLTMTDRLLANVRLAASLFMTEDVRAARVLANEKKVFRDDENRITAAHFARLRQGSVATAETSALHLDLLRDLKAINSHLVAAAAYPVLERADELLPNRLRGDEEVLAD